MSLAEAASGRYPGRDCISHLVPLDLLLLTLAHQLLLLPVGWLTPGVPHPSLLSQPHPWRTRDSFEAGVPAGSKRLAWPLNSDESQPEKVGEQGRTAAWGKISKSRLCCFEFGLPS